MEPEDNPSGVMDGRRCHHFGDHADSHPAPHLTPASPLRAATAKRGTSPDGELTAASPLPIQRAAGIFRRDHRGVP